MCHGSGEDSWFKSIQDGVWDVVQKSDSGKMGGKMMEFR